MSDFLNFGGELHLDGKVQLFNGDSREVLKFLPDASVDSVVTDPPYALVSIVKRFGSENAAPATGDDAYSRASAGFMGKTWDTGETAFAVEFWAEVMRVLKPGGHVVAASGTRTYHRLAVAIEDAGFEIRDMISWLYGSGFPKSHDVSKGIDKAAGLSEQRGYIEATGGLSGGSGNTVGKFTGRQLSNIPVSEAAQQWQGWGTALKPACEPWVLARKPFKGTVAGNVMAHGTGAINVDGCRVEAGGGELKSGTHTRAKDGVHTTGLSGSFEYDGSKGRFPANVIHDGSDEVVAGFPDTGPSKAGNRGKQHSGRHGGLADIGGNIKEGTDTIRGVDDNGGSAARFFYSAKADKMDRIGSKHPTVKPVDLMQYLCRLITPPGGIVLDPFAGSGSTGEAAWREGFRCVLIEREAEYADDIRQRLKLANQGLSSRKRAITKQERLPEDGLFGGQGV